MYKATLVRLMLPHFLTHSLNLTVKNISQKRRGPIPLKTSHPSSGRFAAGTIGAHQDAPPQHMNSQYGRGERRTCMCDHGAITHCQGGIGGDGPMGGAGTGL